jgi:hypothetical protein
MLNLNMLTTENPRSFEDCEVQAALLLHGPEPLHELHEKAQNPPEVRAA